VDLDLGMPERVRTYGFSVYGEDHSWVVDSSGLVDGALFIRIDTTAGPTVEFQDLAASVREQHIKVLEILGLRIE
jgi:hypothetical protein